MKRFLFICILICILEGASAQKLTWDAGQFISKDSSVVFKPMIVSQVHAKYIQLNDGATDASKEPIENIFDISIRRLCFGGDFSSKKFKATFLGGTGTVTAGSTGSITPGGVTTLALYDMYGGFMLNKSNIIGMGQSLFNGLCRASSISSAQTLGSDLISIAFPEIGRTSRFGRQLSIYASGNLSRFGYRMAIVKPFTFAMPAITSGEIAVDFPIQNISYEGYFNVYLLDKEDNTIAGKSFSYNGSKKILNIGAGFVNHPKSSVMRGTANDTIYNDKNSFAADIYLDYPFANKNVLTLYALWLTNDFGPKHYRTSGTIDYLTGKSNVNGIGNSEIFTGTGNTFYAHAGYLFREKNYLSNFQVYSTFCYRDLEVLKDKSMQYSLGLNYYFNGHKLKVGCEFQTRPFYNDDLTLKTYKNTFVTNIHFTL